MQTLLHKLRLTPFRGARRLPEPWILNQDSPQAQGLIMWLPCSPTRDIATITDFTGNATATLHGSGGGVSSDKDPLVYFYSSFNGTDAYVDYGTPTILVLNRSFSISAWVNPNSVTGNRGIVSHGSSEWYLRLNSGKLEFLESNIASIALGSTTLSTNVWTHVAMNIDASGNGSLFVNGAVDATFSTAATFNSGSQKVTLAADTGGTGTVGEFFSGNIADVRVNNVFLHDQVMAQIYNPPTRWDMYSPIRQPMFAPNSKKIPMGLFHQPLGI